MTMVDEKLTRHHKRPRRLGGTNDPRNISLLPRKHHEAWHLLFNHQPPHEIARIINDDYLDPDYYFIVRRRR